MTGATTPAADQLMLPPSVTRRIDVSRLVSELEAIDDMLTQAAARDKVGVASSAQPDVSPVLADFLGINGLAISPDARARGDLIVRMRALKDTAPTIHMTFATEADPDSVRQIVQWLRASVHPQIVVTIGIQPALIAGVYVRTPNHARDFSLRAQLKGGHGILVKELEALRG